MVGGVHPANLSKARYTRGTTAQNPIVVEDEPQVQQQPCIGRRPTHASPSDPAQLPPPTSEQILRTLLKQKNIFPVVVSLLRLLAPGSPSLASVPPGYPHYPYPYPYPYPSYPSQGPGQAHTAFQSQAHTSFRSAADDSRPSSSSGVPPLKRRKLNNVPAGAADWDVPYPFQEGQGPENYRNAWEQERGGRLLKDLVHLVQNAARKAATKAWYQQQIQPTVPIPPALKYYRPATLYYGMERSQSATPPSVLSQQDAALGAQTPGSSTPGPGAYTESGGLPHVPVTSTSASQPTQVPSANYPSNAFDQLVESLLAAQQQHSGASASAHQESADPSSSTAAPSATASPAFDESTQAFFDNWLVTLTTFPPGDPNEASISMGPPPATSAPAVSHTDSSSSTSTVTLNGPTQISDDLIDPALLDVQVNIPMASSPALTLASGTTGSQSHAVPKSTAVLEVHTSSGVRGTAATHPSVGGHTTSPSNPAPPTPSLVDSPSVTVSSLADTAERDGDGGPATPSWGDWGLPDPQELEASMKLLDGLAGMDVVADADEAMDLDTDGWEEVLLASATPTADAQPTMPPTAAEQEERQSTKELSQPPLNLDVRNESLAFPHPQSETGQSSAIPDNLLASRENRQDPQPSQLCPSSQTPAILSPQDAAAPAGHPQTPHTLVIPSTDASIVLPAQPLRVATKSVAPARPTARAKGKAKAIPGTGNVIGHGTGAAGKQQDKRAVLERARAMRAALAKEVERAKVALWETTLEQGVLVGLGRELEKESQQQQQRAERS
ncbi:hypothetical protein VTO73DRAFT_8343 [Trametes versicolor]